MPKRKAVKYTEANMYRGEPIGEDPDLAPWEKETVFAFTRADEEVHVLSWEASIIRRLLALDHFRVIRLLLRNGTVVYLEGTLPIGALKVPAVPRTASSHAKG